MLNKDIKIAIIGAGWTGIGCLRMLSEQGYSIDVFEKMDDIGGTWHPKNWYANLKIHSPAAQIEYFDYPLPSNIVRSERLTALQVFEYLKSYCKQKGFLNYMRFNILAKNLYYDSVTKKVKLQLCDTISFKEEFSQDYDYVIYTNGFCNRNIPEFVGIEKFTGNIYHSIDVDIDLLKSIVINNKKITVLGGNKTATDFILNFNNMAYKVNWLYRKPYYFYLYENFQKILDGHLKNKNVAIVNQYITLISFLLIPYFPNFSSRLLRLFGIIKTYGKSHSDIKRNHGGILDKKQLSTLRSYNKEHGIESDVASLSENSIILTNGNVLESDTIICCTGSGITSKNIIGIYIDNIKMNPESFIRAYRGKILPELPNVIFTAQKYFSTGVVNGLNNGNWIKNYIKNDISVEQLEKESIIYNQSFLLHQPHFSKDNLSIKDSTDFVSQFFNYGELDKLTYIKWLFKELMYSSKGAKPLEFKSLKNK